MSHSIDGRHVRDWNLGEAFFDTTWLKVKVGKLTGATTQVDVGAALERARLERYGVVFFNTREDEALCKQIEDLASKFCTVFKQLKVSFWCRLTTNLHKLL